MNHKTHSYLMIGLVVAGAVFFFSGVVDGGALFLLWPLACVAMMVAMMWGMGGMSRGAKGAHPRGRRDSLARRRPGGYPHVGP